MQVGKNSTKAQRHWLQLRASAVQTATPPATTMAMVVVIEGFDDLDAALTAASSSSVSSPSSDTARWPLLLLRGS